MHKKNRWPLNRSHRGRYADTDQRFNTGIPAHRACLQAFVKPQGEPAKLHTEIGNSAVNEYNDYVTEMSKAAAEK